MQKIAFLIVCSQAALAQDFGVHGHTYPVSEPDLLKQITGKLNALKEEGKLERHQKTMRQKAQDSIRRPISVPGIARTTQTATRYHDPSISVPYDLKDHKGEVFQKAGTRINPLTFRSLSKPILFIDGDDKTQVTWVEGFHNARIILVAGSPFELTEALSRPIYFDQGGALTQKLSISSVPARVSQEGLLLKIEEIVIPEGSQ